MEVLALPFVQRALVAVALAAPLLGLLSPLVLARRLAFFSAALGQAVLTGVALGVLLGEPVDAPWASVLGFSLLCGVGLVFVRRRSRLPPDTLVGVLLAVTLGVGVLLLTVVTKRFNVHQLEAAMFGSVLTTSAGDLWLLAVTLALVLGALTRFHNALLLDTVDPRLSAARRLPAAHLEYGFVVLLTLAIVASVKVMGALMVEAMLLVPAAAGRLVARSLAGVTWVSVGVAAWGGVGGVLVSTRLNAPSGAAIVLMLALAFALLAPLARWRRPGQGRGVSGP
ncbi:MAG: metal ABC transporter permease [Myxococcaceae bacterium]|nr:metal ABC transporter permease [Myxococcaceae bacterium]